jgi:hypothetical protein
MRAALNVTFSPTLVSRILFNHGHVIHVLSVNLEDDITFIKPFPKTNPFLALSERPPVRVCSQVFDSAAPPHPRLGPQEASTCNHTTPQLGKCIIFTSLWSQSTGDGLAPAS